MTDTFTTQQAALMLDRSYDYTRKLLAHFHEPVEVIGRNKMWSLEQIMSLPLNQ